MLLKIIKKMEGILSMDNILQGDEINLEDLNESAFLDSDVDDTSTSELEEVEENENNNTTETDEDDSQLESVGSEDNSQETGNNTTSESDSSSPNNFYSSIAEALKEDGIFPSLDDNTLKEIKTPEDFANIINSEIEARFNEKQKRIDEALNAGVEVSEVKQYEQTIDYLNNITEDLIIDESDKGELLRKQLIYRDFINRGYSDARAQREVQKSLNSGSDIDDAREALISNKEFFSNQYKSIIDSAKAEELKLIKEKEEQAAKLKQSLIEDKQVFGEIELDNKIRQQIYDNISKPVFKDPETNEYMTAIQKYESENRTDFLKYVGLMFTLTDGFKNIDKLVQPRVNKQMNKGVRHLEKVIANTSRSTDGNLQFTSGVGDAESFSSDWDIDV